MKRPGGDLHTWRYVEGGTVAHALRPGTGETTAMCGLTVEPADEWRGTGTHDEYETVERLHACRRCHKVIIRGGAVTPELV